MWTVYVSLMRFLVLIIENVGKLGIVSEVFNLKWFKIWFLGELTQYWKFKCENTYINDILNV